MNGKRLGDHCGHVYYLLVYIWWIYVLTSFQSNVCMNPVESSYSLTSHANVPFDTLFCLTLLVFIVVAFALNITTISKVNIKIAKQKFEFNIWSYLHLILLLTASTYSLTRLFYLFQQWKNCFEVVTRFENSPNVSCVIFFCSACCLSSSLMEFSMVLMCGLQGGILSCFAFKVFRAWCTLAQFCTGSLSCTNRCLPFFPSLWNNLLSSFPSTYRL